MSIALISYRKLAPLRLRQFLPVGTEIVEHGGFKWMGGFWLYEGLAFTWFGRLEESPSATIGLELNFEELDTAVLQKILATIGLPIAPGMTAEGVEGALGPRHMTKIYANDRRTYVFKLSDPDAYEVSCTIHNDLGLIHVSLIGNDVRRRLAVA